MNWMHQADRVAGLRKFGPYALMEVAKVTSEKINTGQFGFLEDDSVAAGVHGPPTYGPGPTGRFGASYK